MTTDPASVSVVVLSGRGDTTFPTLRSIYGLDWPTERLEIIVVCGEAEAAHVQRSFPTARVVRRPASVGTSEASNIGASHASGRYLAFLEGTGTCDRAWLTEAVRVMEDDDTVGCAASRVTSSDAAAGFVGAGISFDGQPVVRRADVDPPHPGDGSSDVLCPSRAAMVMPTDVFREIGGFDQRFFGHLDDVDLGWRIWLVGYRVRYVPSSVVHRHAPFDADEPADIFVRERNALFALYKNLDRRNLDRVLPATLLLSTRRGIVRSKLHVNGFDPTPTREPGVETGDVSWLVASAAAQDAFLTQLGDLSVERERIQANRRCPDSQIMALIRQPFLSTESAEALAPALTQLVDEFELDKIIPSRRILVITNDMLGARMAGPAIRAREIASVLSAQHDVVLASLVGSDMHDPRFHVCHASGSELQRLVDRSEVIVFQGHFLQHNPSLVGLDRKVLVVDLYDPFQLENLVMGKHLHMHHRVADNNDAIESLDEQMARGDFFLCASEKQRDFWLGSLSALGRINPHVYDEDASLRTLIDVVPFGLPADRPQRSGPGVRGTVAGIAEDDKLIIWAGGIYNWFDPCTLIRAMAPLSEALPNVRLFFMGMTHPNPEVPTMRVAADAADLARALGLLDTHVFFNDGWIPYDDRQNYLLDADVGVSTHFDHSETAYSFRTRILDYFWAQLPVVTTAGDAMADIVESRRVGAVVPPEDPKALSAALFHLLDDDGARAECRERLAVLRDDYVWDRALRPLTEFCRSARAAPDRQYARVTRREVSERLAAPAATSARRWRGLHHDLAVAQAMIEEGGVRRLASQAGVRVRRWFARPTVARRH